MNAVTTTLAVLVAVAPAVADELPGPRPAEAAPPPEAATLDPAGPAVPDASKVVGPGECSECHEDAHAVWTATGHAKGWATLARSAHAREIAAALGLSRVRAPGPCMGCHLLPAVREDGVAVIAGVACEHCHGAAADWLDLHWDLGGGESGVAEDPEHRAARLAASAAAGLVLPADLHELGGRCYRCHLVPDPALVDGTPHPAAADFDLVASTQGSIRHNFLRGSGANAPASAARQRVLHVMGRLLQLEWSLRALSEANGPGRHAEALAATASRARADLEGVQAARATDEVARALAAATDVALEPGGPSLLPAADRVAEAARAFQAAHDGADLAPSASDPE